MAVNGSPITGDRVLLTPEGAVDLPEVDEDADDTALEKRADMLRLRLDPEVRRLIDYETKRLHEALADAVIRVGEVESRLRDAQREITRGDRIIGRMVREASAKEEA